MSLLSWLKGLRKREDEAALRRAAEGDFEGKQADEQVGLIFREAADEPERLAERDDE